MLLNSFKIHMCLDLSSNLSGVESGKPTHFTVLTKGAGKAPVDVSFSSPIKDFDIIDNYDYSQTVKYTPAEQVRRLQLSCTWGEEDV